MKTKKINIIHNNTEKSLNITSLLKEKLEHQGFCITDSFSYDAFLNICVGGDGAFLRAIHNFDFTNIPFIGINTGTLGFFQEVSPENLDLLIQKIKNQDYKIEPIFLVEGIICTRTSCIELIAINEIVIKGYHSKTIHLNVSIDNNYLEKFSGDGVIVSTPIGSTAYNFSCGGSLVYPTLDVLQLTPIAPINSKAYRSLTSSIIVPNSLLIQIKPEYRDENSILIVVDGQEHKYENIVEISFKISSMKANILTLGNHSFWTNVKDKFL
ncbi:NAD(+)/NADH kinase [Abyssisolibacter fermentans]|uniref:NAD(+)/NADH kinase n=1 Tax=Abyssisolibacter fermentans TaxID=1766203 RepID=UPI00083412C6|nr:NAD(+)/NADH kinase [Abyssisolibacter fermentans]